MQFERYIVDGIENYYLFDSLIIENRREYDYSTQTDIDRRIPEWPANEKQFEL